MALSEDPRGAKGWPLIKRRAKMGPGEGWEESVPEQRSAPRWAWGVMGAVTLWLAVQVLVPLRAAVSHPAEVRTDFSWDMFAVRRDCEVCELRLSHGGQPAARVPWKRLFRSPSHVGRARNKERLPLLAREICRQERAAGRADARVTVACRCRYNNAPDLIDLDTLGGLDCAAEAAARDE